MIRHPDTIQKLFQLVQKQERLHSSNKLISTQHVGNLVNECDYCYPIFRITLIENQILNPLLFIGDTSFAVL